MKRIAMVFTVIFMLTPLMAHNGTQVKKLNEVLKLRNGQNVQFQDVKLPKMAKYVQKLKQAKSGDLSFFLFSAKGDWGPFTGLVTLKAGTIVAVDILSFTRHDSDAFTKSAFLGQFTGLKMMAFHNKEFKAVPGEPLNLKALKEAVMLAFHNGMGMMMMKPDNSKGEKMGHGMMMKDKANGAMMKGDGGHAMMMKRGDTATAPNSNMQNMMKNCKMMKKGDTATASNSNMKDMMKNCKMMKVTASQVVTEESRSSQSSTGNVDTSTVSNDEK